MKVVVAATLARMGLELHTPEWRRNAELLRRREVDLIIDVGAATGRYGLQLRRSGYTASIISFEPLAKSFDSLLRVSARDDRWIAVRKALGAVAHDAIINVAANYDSSSLLPMLERHRSAAPEGRYVRKEVITVARLDDELALHAPAYQRPFLKMDVQGFERDVLSGAPKTLERLIGVQIELSFVPLYDGGMLYDEALTFLRDLGFVPAGIQAGFRDGEGALLQADIVMLRPRRGS